VLGLWRTSPKSQVPSGHRDGGGSTLFAFRRSLNPYLGLSLELKRARVGVCGKKAILRNDISLAVEPGFKLPAQWGRFNLGSKFETDPILPNIIMCGNGLLCGLSLCIPFGFEMSNEVKIIYQLRSHLCRTCMNF
jgi:hypothetical protein